MTNSQIADLNEYRRDRGKRPNDREMWRVWRWIVLFLAVYLVTLKMTGVL